MIPLKSFETSSGLATLPQLARFAHATILYGAAKSIQLNLHHNLRYCHSLRILLCAK